jgi:hypothetical protein
MKKYILLLLPILCKLSVKTVPIKIVRPIVALILLYIATIIAAKLRCKQTTLKDILVKSLIPISVFIVLTILSYVSKFIPLAPIKIASRLLNSILGWFIFGFLFRSMFNNTFDMEKC